MNGQSWKIKEGFCVYVWWLGDPSGDRHAGLPCVWECVCVCETCWGRERRGVTRSPNSCLGDRLAARDVQQTQSGRESNSTTNMRYSDKETDATVSKHTQNHTHHCNKTYGDQLISSFFIIIIENVIQSFLWFSRCSNLITEIYFSSHLSLLLTHLCWYGTSNQELCQSNSCWVCKVKRNGNKGEWHKGFIGKQAK